MPCLTDMNLTSHRSYPPTFIPTCTPQESMVTSFATKTLEVPHHTIFQVVASEAGIKMFGRVFLDVPDALLSTVGDVNEYHSFSRAQKYLMVPKAQGLCPLLPQGASVPEIVVSVKAELPSSVVMTFDLDQGREITLEGHVHPESYGTSRLTLTVHRNFAKWPGAHLMVRCESHGNNQHAYSRSGVTINCIQLVSMLT